MANNTRFLSIIIPCYNVADYLIGTIDSLRNLKDAEDCEFIFINDGSTDNTLAIIQDFEKQDNRVRVINQKNAGVSAARNAALKIAQGKYFIPLDGDDKLQPSAVSIIRNTINDTDLLITPVQKVQNNNIINLYLPFKDGIYTPAELFKACKMFPASSKLVYRTDLINKYDIRFNEHIHSGEVLTYTCAFLKYCKRIAVSSQYFYQYVMRDSSATHAPNYKKDISVLDIIDYINQNTNPSIINLYAYQATLFRMCTSFTYNKYAKLGLTEKNTIDAIKNVINHENYKILLKKLARSFGKFTKDRLQALYILTTGIWGYKFLATILRKCHLNKNTI